MKKTISILVLSISTSFVLAQNSQSAETIHSGKVIGSFEFGSKEVTTILDESTGCVRKSTPHTKSLFTPNETVEIVLKENKQLAEVRKPSLPEQVFANKKCEDNVNPIINLRPNTYPEIADFYGNQHNAVLEFSIVEKPVNHINQFIARFNDFYKKTDFKLTNDVQDIPEVESWVESKATLLAKINELENSINVSEVILQTEKEIYVQIFSTLRLFIENGDHGQFYNSLLVIKSNCLIGRSEIQLLNPNQEMVKPLSVIGIGIKTTEYWLQKLNTGFIDIVENPNEPAGIAPWVAADLVGGAVGALGTAFSDAVTGTNSSWGQFGANVAWGALTGSGLSWAKWW
jgi:hypothetical protein